MFDFQKKKRDEDINNNAKMTTEEKRQALADSQIIYNNQVNKWTQTESRGAQHHQTMLEQSARRAKQEQAQIQESYERMSTQAERYMATEREREELSYNQKRVELRQWLANKQISQGQFDRQEIMLKNVHDKNLEELEQKHQNRIRQQKNRAYDLQRQNAQQAAQFEKSLAEGVMQNTMDILDATGHKKSAAYKAMFLMEKGMALSEVMINTQEAASKAMGQTGLFGIAMVPMIEALGAAQMGIIAGTAIAGMFDTGGSIPTGKYGIVGEYGPELVRGPATVTDRQGTAALARQGGGDNQTIIVQQTINIQGAGDAHLAAALKKAAMDGAKQGVSMVHKDMASNGPIRRTLGR